MKKLLILLLLLPLAASARMFPTEFPVKAVCWNDVSEALAYHQEMLGEYPIGKGWIDSKDGPSFGAIMYNPNKPSWTFLSFHRSEITGAEGVIVCAITGGSVWEIIHPGDEAEKLEI
jgi:hypothetical protein